MDHGFPLLQIYDTPLEEVHGYHGFTDIVEKFYLERGRGDGEEEDGKAGEFKGAKKPIANAKRRRATRKFSNI